MRPAAGHRNCSTESRRAGLRVKWDCLPKGGWGCRGHLLQLTHAVAEQEVVERMALYLYVKGLPDELLDLGSPSLGVEHQKLGDGACVFGVEFGGAVAPRRVAEPWGVRPMIVLVDEGPTRLLLSV